MARKANFSPPLTRAAAKRAAAAEASASQPPSKKQRSVLTASSRPGAVSSNIKKTRPAKKGKLSQSLKIATTVVDVSSVNVSTVYTTVQDPQMVAPYYASHIYSYLRSMESAMARKENFSPRLTRAATKRAAAAEASASHPLLNKQRSVLVAPPRPRAVPCAVPWNIKKTRPGKKGKLPQSVKTATTVVDVSSVNVSTTDIAMEDPQMVAPYASHIYHYLRSMEVQKKRRPLVGYMETKQVNLTADMRAFLVDWVVHVAEAYKLVPETLFLTVSYIDRFLSYNIVELQKLLLLGATALIIAAKYEEIRPLTVKDICSITPRAYNKQEILEMERVVLKSLKYEIGNPTAVTFLRRFTKGSNSTVEFLAQYLAELSLMDYGCIKFLPSVVAASAIFLARSTILATYPWSDEMERRTGYNVSDLKECIYALLQLQLSKRCCSLRAVRDKYNKTEFEQVATLPPKEKLLDFFFIIEDKICF